MSPRRRLGWVVTGVMAVLMLMSAVPDVLRIPDAIAVFRPFAGLTFGSNAEL